MTAALRRAAFWLLPAAALIYLALALAEAELSTIASHLGAEVLWIGGAAALLYGAGLYLLALAWALCLQHFARAPVDRSSALRLYAFATFAKYLPGNVFHYAGRQIAAARLGYGQKAPAQATLTEILGHLAAVGLILGAMLPFAFAGLSDLWTLVGQQLGHWPLVAGLGLALAAAALVMVPRLRGALPPFDARLLAVVGALQIAFFAMTALLGLWLALPMLDLDAQSLPLLAFVYLAAWLVGFVTPGAPGGLGVREACLLAGLGGVATPEAVLAFAVVSRGALLLGEALFALSGFLLRPASDALSVQSRRSLPVR